MSSSSSDEIGARTIEYFKASGDVRIPSETGFKVLRLAFDMAAKIEEKLKSGKMKSDDPEKKIVSIRIRYWKPNENSLWIAFKTPQDVTKSVHTHALVYYNDKKVRWTFEDSDPLPAPFHGEKRADNAHKNDYDGPVEWLSREQIEKDVKDSQSEEFPAFCKKYDHQTIITELDKYYLKRK